jgi:hypothetical protein
MFHPTRVASINGGLEHKSMISLFSLENNEFGRVLGDPMELSSSPSMMRLRQSDQISHTKKRL